MDRKRILVTVGIVLVLAILVYFQFRTWKNFDWTRFFEYRPDWRHVLHGIVLIYLAYFLRAVRWKVFLRPVRQKASLFGLVPPTLIGFAGLALLGRPGELIRPYLVARRESLSFASQLAVWAVERIFDIAGFTTLMIGAIFLPSKLRAFAAERPAIEHWLHVTGYVLAGLVLGLLAGAMLVGLKGSTIADWVETRFAHLAGNLGRRIAQRVREFASGLDTIHDFISFIELSVISISMWWLIAVAYKEVTHAYGTPMQAMSVTKVLLLMGSSMIGSLVQLPGVGGGSQLATISALDHIFAIPKELAASCGIMLWLVTFVSVVPVGLALAHRERLSLRKLSEQSQKEEEVAVILSQPPLA